MLAPRLPVVAVILNMPMGAPTQSWNLPLRKYWAWNILYPILSKMKYTSVWDVFSRSLDITARAMTQYRLEVDRPDVIIRPQVFHIDTLDIVDVREVAKLGEEAVEAALPQLRGLFTLRNRWRRTIGVYNQRSL
jgi:hypothetical protein